MSLIVVGLNHRTAPVQVRELLSFTCGRAAQLLEKLRENHGGEHLFLSTCNRSELYHAGGADGDALVGSLLSAAEEPPAGVHDSFYCHRDRDAAIHLFRVAAGIDSMVVGEYEILNQVREAVAAARAAGALGPTLSRLFDEALAAGKRVRTETDISRGVFSVGGCAVALARALFGDLRGARVVVIGAGEMAEAVAGSLMSSGAQSVFVANRTYAHACELARLLGGKAVHFDQLIPTIQASHIVISSTAAPHPVVTREMVASAMSTRPDQPLFLVDIAVPRDVEEAVAGIENVHLYNIDDLRTVVQQDGRARLSEVAKAEELLLAHVRQFECWQLSREALPAIRDLQERFEEIREREVKEALRRMPHLSQQERVAIERLSRAIVRRLLHEPVSRLRNAVTDQGEAVESLRRLFDLPAACGETPEREVP